MVHLDTGCPCEIGRDVSVGHGCILHGCVLEDEVLVGMGATILNRAVIGRGSVVAAGALVLEGTQVPAFSLVAGVPAQVKKTYPAEERSAAQRRHAAGYVAKARRFRADLKPRTPLSLGLALLAAAAAAALALRLRRR